MTYVESEYIGYDGTRMFMHTWIPSEGRPRASIIAIHGLGSHGGDMKTIGEFFEDKGLAVFAPDMRGFGHYSGRKGHVMNFDEYTEDISNIIEQVKDQFPGRIIYLFGHSLGGLHAIRYVATYPKDVDGLILSSPSVSEKLPIGKGTRIGASLLSLLNAKLYFDNGVNIEYLSRDPEVVKRHREDPLRFDKATPRFAHSGFKSVKEGWNAASLIRLPTLMLQAGDDHLVDAEKNKEWFENLASEDKTLNFYDGFYHEVFEEPEKERVLNDIYSWLEIRLPT
jgi:alpha-beta hydrolase superfamily lysophospholipase